MTIAIVDYGMGNVRSLHNAISYFGHDVVITSDWSELNDAERIVLPGVGAFGDAMKAIHARGLDEILNRQALEQKKPMLGICLGMQLFAKRSNEHGEHEGLGWIDADIRRLQVLPPTKIPHVGWNNLIFDDDVWLFKGIKQAEANFYFVHSFHMVCNNKSDLVAMVDYDGSVTAAVIHDNFTAVQFHPEKSQNNGLKMLENWIAWTP